MFHHAQHVNITMFNRLGILKLCFISIIAVTAIEQVVATLYFFILISLFCIYAKGTPWLIADAVALSFIEGN